MCVPYLVFTRVKHRAAAEQPRFTFLLQNLVESTAGSVRNVRKCKLRLASNFLCSNMSGDEKKVGGGKVTLAVCIIVSVSISGPITTIIADHI